MVLADCMCARAPRARCSAELGWLFIFMSMGTWTCGFPMVYVALEAPVHKPCRFAAIPVATGAATRAVRWDVCTLHLAGDACIAAFVYGNMRQQQQQQQQQNAPTLEQDGDIDMGVRCPRVHGSTCVTVLRCSRAVTTAAQHASCLLVTDASDDTSPKYVWQSIES